MKRSYLTLIIAFFLAVAMCVALSACVKQNAGANVTYAPALSAESKVGDEVSFGSYPQSNAKTKEPLIWIVLDVDESKHAMLLLSKYVIDEQPYHTKAAWGKISDRDLREHSEEYADFFTWANSTLRAWLNDKFIDTAFSSTEKERILETHLTTPNPHVWYACRDWFSSGKIYCMDYDEIPTVETNDKVFLLSWADIMKKSELQLKEEDFLNSGRVFTSDDRDASDYREAAYATEYALRQHESWGYVRKSPSSCAAFERASTKITRTFASLSCSCEHLNCETSWWLRSPGRTAGEAQGVYSAGYYIPFKSGGGSEVNGIIGVRPAIWVQY